MGEVFDKVGKRLGLPYPQGPRVDELAERGTPGAAASPSPLSQRDPRLLLLGLEEPDPARDRAPGAELGPHRPRATAPSRRRPSSTSSPASAAAAVGQIVDRLDRSTSERPIGLLAVSGGVAANRLLRRELPAWAERSGVELRLVPLVYSGDNAAMIAHAALLRHRRGLADDPFTAEAESRIPL